MRQHQVYHTSINKLITAPSYLPFYMLYQSDISFMEAKNGEEAFERVVEAVMSFELIITDIQMPICDGFQFTRKVRRWLMELDTLFKCSLSHIRANQRSADVSY